MKESNPPFGIPMGGAEVGFHWQGWSSPTVVRTIGTGRTFIAIAIAIAITIAIAIAIAIALSSTFSYHFSQAKQYGSNVGLALESIIG